jgi:hypothetical protein
VTHPRQVRIDSATSRAANDGFDRRLDLAMINGNAVQRDQRHTVAVLDIAEPDAPGSPLPGRAAGQPALLRPGRNPVLSPNHPRQLLKTRNNLVQQVG